MNNSIPSRFLRDITLLLNVPRSEFLDVPECKDPFDQKSRLDFFKLLRGKTKSEPQPKVNPKQKHIRQFNTAVWLSFKNPPDKPVALLLQYKDSKGEFSIIVDESTPDSSTTMMLSGDTNLEFYGELEYLKAIATGLKKDHLFFVEEIHVQRIRSKGEKKDNTNYWLVSNE
ncbi:hypothetical protein [Litoribrevibacter albus]|uniref:Uncharacterized protein n=1 Tax=Litoribrevibacter albus TaxID=1473156 RepID=A0AA37S8N6_9GAMM|nr:hypothetical protein [Litoribrevibacter albus]GLQ31110.1 hypothetical protein GCM10007876_15890 [Litoribrevibacter albus]